MDVVPAEKYECIETEKEIKGRGAFDMKGSVATALELFKNLDTKKKVALFITSDEEITALMETKIIGEKKQKRSR